MVGVKRVPEYVAETSAGAARLQEQTTPEQYAALVDRARRLLEGLLSVETNVPPELQVKIALREKFDPARVKQSILMVATWQLIQDLASGWSVRRSAAPVRTAALEALVR